MQVHIFTQREKRILFKNLLLFKSLSSKIKCMYCAYSRNRTVCIRNNQKTRKRSWKLKTCLPYAHNLSLTLSFSLFLFSPLFLSCTHKLTLININYNLQTSCMNIFYGRHIIPDDVHYQIRKGFLVALSDEALGKHFSVGRLILGPLKIHFLL